MNKIVMVIVLSAWLLSSVPAVSKVDRYHGDMRGTITEIRNSDDAKHRLGSIMVEADDKNAKVDKANLIITDKTRILKEEDGKRVHANFRNLQVGQVIEAEFVEGPTIMIYPLQVVAAEIVILNAAD